MRAFFARRWLVPLIAGVALAVLASSDVSALDGEPPRDLGGGETAPPAEPSAFGGAQAPNARLAGLFDAGGAPIRTKGVQSIQQTATGVYCIGPIASSGVTPAKAIVTASPEYFYSELDEIEVQWASSGSGCGARIGVYTFADPNQDGIYSFSNSVGFSVYVP